MLRWSVVSSPGYKSLPKDPDQDFEREPVSRVSEIQQRLRLLAISFGWLLAFLLGLIVAAIYLLRPVYSYETGFKTDYAAAQVASQLVTVRFTGTPGFHKNGTAYVVDPSEPRYVGPPSEEVDAAWDQLIGARYFAISDEEARQTWGENYQQYYKHPQAGYRIGLDVLHTLHCLNVIRKTIYSDYYPKESMMIPHFQEYHVDHCIDLIRQSLQCHSDLTPIPIRYFEGIGRGFIDSSQVHTCRDFQKVRAWAYQAS